MKQPPSPQLDRQRRMQIGGLLIIALLVLIFTLCRAGWHAIVPHRLW